ncbi:MAG: hypothetical protein COU51_04120 [Parcubacteria group bacterium CG10_big_fil_rev_8_21_14_0_10_36_14]|nr:MAG: hypothetical protein COU51_04120 [Parcubacteria group bacterium CG10_big_fil_rev_8_21_14_0_10_36_14]
MQTKDSINKYAGCYNTEVDFDRYFIDFRFRCLQENYPNLGDALELGCANGLMTKNLLEISKSLEVVEGGEHYILATKKKLGAKAEAIKFNHSLFIDFESNKKYDAIIFSSMLHEVDEPVELLKKYKNLIKEDGMIYINVPNAQSLHRQIGKEMGMLENLYEFNERDIKFCHQRIYDMKSLVADIEGAGWQIKKKGGFFLKMLSNSQLNGLEPKMISALYNVSKDIPAELCAEIYVFATL